MRKTQTFAALTCTLTLIACGSPVEEKIVDKPLRVIEPAGITQAPATTPEESAPRVTIQAQNVASQGGTPQWTIPSDWTQVPANRMILAAYRLPSDAVLSISSLGGGGSDEANLVRWARQLGITYEPAMLESARRSVPGAQLPLSRYHMASDEKAFDIGIYREEGTAWFFKLDGTPESVASSEGAFLGFLASIQGNSEEEPAPLMLTAQADTPVMSPGEKETETPAMRPLPGMAEQVAAIGGASWSRPETWKTGPANAMRKGTYLISGSGGDAELAISAFPGDVGGLIANVNRWRQQAGQPPLDEAGILNSIEKRDLPAGPAHLMLIEGNGRPSTLGAILPHANETWFFKMTGPLATLQEEVATFEAFLKTVSF